MSLNVRRVSTDRRVACTVPIDNGKGDQLETGKNRAIGVFSVVGKIYANFLLDHEVESLETEICEKQCGNRTVRNSFISFFF